MGPAVEEAPRLVATAEGIFAASLRALVVEVLAVVMGDFDAPKMAVPAVGAVVVVVAAPVAVVAVALVVVAVAVLNSKILPPVGALVVASAAGGSNVLDGKKTEDAGAALVFEAAVVLAVAGTAVLAGFSPKMLVVLAGAAVEEDAGLDMVVDGAAKADVVLNKTLEAGPAEVPAESVDFCPKIFEEPAGNGMDWAPKAPLDFALPLLNKLPPELVGVEEAPDADDTPVAPPKRPVLVGIKLADAPEAAAAVEVEGLAPNMPPPSAGVVFMAGEFPPKGLGPPDPPEDGTWPNNPVEVGLSAGGAPAGVVDGRETGSFAGVVV